MSAKTVRLLAGTRQKGESSKAAQACNDYLRMGPSRSLRGVIELYTDSQNQQKPTGNLNTLKEWSTKFGWVQRAETYDARTEEKKTRRAEEIMNSGLALEHERTEELKKLYALLSEQLFEADPATGVLHNLWMKDFKSLGGGDYLEIERFNAALIREMRATLADIAAEAGGRVEKREVVGDLNVGITDHRDEIQRRLADLAAAGDAKEVS